MNTDTFLKLTMKDVPSVDLTQLPDDPIGYAEVKFIKIPLYGELLGVETVIFNEFSEITKNLNSKLNLIANEVKKRYGCKRADIISEVIESLTVNGFYSKLKQGDIKPFNVKGLEELILKINEKPYNASTLIYDDGDTSLRALAYAADLESVQGETVEEKIRNISLKIPFVTDYSLEVIDINEVLNNFPGVYDQYESFLFANTPDALLKVLLYTRAGISHNVLGNLKVSDIEKLRTAVDGEIKKPSKTKTNSAKNKSTDEKVETEDTKSNQRPSRGDSDEQTESPQENNQKGDDES